MLENRRGKLVDEVDELFKFAKCLLFIEFDDYLAGSIRCLVGVSVAVYTNVL